MTQLVGEFSVGKEAPILGALMNSELNICIEDICDIDVLQLEWERLAGRAEGSFFLSWYWIENWLLLQPDGVSLKQVIVRQEGKVVALAVFSESKIRRHGVFSSTVMALHEYSMPGLNMVIEYNGLLIDKQLDAKTIQQDVIRFLVLEAPDWEELQVSGVLVDSAFVDALFLQGVNLKPLVVGESEARRVNLEKIREAGDNYLSTLTKKTRYKIRQYIKEYQNCGELSVNKAESLDVAFHYFEELKKSHQSYWIKKGQAGSFSNKNWENFHHDIIKSAFSDGGIQLLRISAGTTIVGYLYNLVWEGHVYMIQSGFNYTNDKNDKAYHPGYVCLTLAIEYNVKMGHRVFDFLAGENQYKKSLSNEGVKLQWVMLQRKKMKFWVEDLLRLGKRKVLGQSSDVSF